MGQQDCQDQPDWRDSDTRAVHEDLAEWVKWLRRQPPGSKRLNDLRELNDLLDKLPPQEVSDWLNQHQPDINCVALPVQHRSQPANEADV